MIILIIIIVLRIEFYFWVLFKVARSLIFIHLTIFVYTWWSVNLGQITISTIIRFICILRFVVGISQNSINCINRICVFFNCIFNILFFNILRSVLFYWFIFIRTSNTSFFLWSSSFFLMLLLFFSKFFFINSRINVKVNLYRFLLCSGVKFIIHLTWTLTTRW